MQTPIIANKRKAGEALKKSEFEAPTSKRARNGAAVPATPVEATTPLRD